MAISGYDSSAYPHPYLTPQEVNEKLQILGFITGPEVLDLPIGHQHPQIDALKELIAGAIADFIDVRDDIDDQGEGVDYELLSFVEEYIVQQ